MRRLRARTVSSRVVSNDSTSKDPLRWGRPESNGRFGFESKFAPDGLGPRLSKVLMHDSPMAMPGAHGMIKAAAGIDNIKVTRWRRESFQPIVASKHQRGSAGAKCGN